MENNNEKYLPIGTIVLLKGGKKELMITSFGILPQGKIYEEGQEVDGVGKVYDYGACIYPEGVLNPDQIMCFNNENIEKICFMGYNTTAHHEFANSISEALSKLKSGVPIEQLKAEEGQA